MQFAIGSDAGIRGLPGQLISGDSGWLGTGEINWNIWRNKNNAVALVPFIGCGGVRTTVNGFTASDIAGAGGILVRWLHGEDWSTELGYVDQIETANNIGPWNNWLLDKGLYAQLKYKF
jgi:hemolysin activation/secretion protein